MMNYTNAIEKARAVIQDNFIVVPPVRIDEIARNYGLNVIQANFKNYSREVAGFIDLAKKTIYVNASDSDTRKAFTIAHELGHYLLHLEKLQDPNNKISVLYRKPIGELNSDPIEKEANCFAANILVPMELLEKYKGEDVNTIAKIFGVSPEVIGYRIWKVLNQK